MRRALVTGWKDYGGRIIAWALNPVLILGVPVIVAKAQQWFGYHLTPTQVRDYMLVGAVAVVTPVVLWLINNAKFEKVVEYLAKRLGVTPAVLSAHLAQLDQPQLAAGAPAPPALPPPLDDEPADVPGI